MYVEVPRGLPITLLPPEFRADDKRVEALEIHPGDEILYLGFPFNDEPLRISAFARGDSIACEALARVLGLCPPQIGTLETSETATFSGESSARA
jgi:hypothetical protein